MNDQVKVALVAAESILSLLHYRGLVDNELNRQDVAAALDAVRRALTVVE